VEPRCISLVLGPTIPRQANRDSWRELKIESDRTSLLVQSSICNEPIGPSGACAGGSDLAARQNDINTQLSGSLWNYILTYRLTNEYFDRRTTPPTIIRLSEKPRTAGIIGYAVHVQDRMAQPGVKRVEMIIDRRAHCSIPHPFRDDETQNLTKSKLQRPMPLRVHR
jgi:hypothetical protein